MNRLLVICVLTAFLAGCRSSSCCRKPTTCQSCPPPPVILGNASSSSRPPEILLPSPPGSTAPLTAPTPAQTIPLPPPPTTSGFAPAPEFPPSRVANVPATTPEIRLEKPEFSETAQKTNVALKPVAATNLQLGVEPTEVVAGKVATGRRPTLDDLDRLQQMGIRQVVDLSDRTNANAKAVLAARSMQVTVIDGNDAAGRKIVARASKELTAPVYVFADDSQVLRAFWQRYYRENEFLSDDAAKICAARLIP